VGLLRENCYIVNVCNCYSTSYKGYDLDGPQIEACRSRFVAEVQKSRAKVVLCLGKDAFQHTTGIKHPLEKARGYFYDLSNCKPLTYRIREQTGVTKCGFKCETCATKGFLLVDEKPVECVDCGGRGKAPHPKYGYTVKTIPSPLPKTVKWIIPTYSPKDVQLDALRSVIAMKVDADRAVRALSGAAPETVEWRRR
jgi:hypothetical protein